jgi:hypothetical protein
MWLRSIFLLAYNLFSADKPARIEKKTAEMLKRNGIILLYQTRKEEKKK